MNPPDRPEVEKLCAGFSRLVQLIEAQMLIPTETTMKTWFNSNSDCNSPSIHTRTIRSSPVGSAPNHRCFIGPLQNHQVPRLMLMEFWPCSFSLLIGCWFDQIRHFTWIHTWFYHNVTNVLLCPETVPGDSVNVFYRLCLSSSWFLRLADQEPSFLKPGYKADKC